MPKTFLETYFSARWYGDRIWHCPIQLSEGKKYVQSYRNLKNYRTFKKNTKKNFTYRTACISMSSLCSFFSSSSSFFFCMCPVYVLFCVGSLGKGHIESIQGIKCGWQANWHTQKSERKYTLPVLVKFTLPSISRVVWKVPQHSGQSPGLWFWRCPFGVWDTLLNLSDPQFTSL